MRRPIVRDSVLSELRSRIARGQYSPGAPIPTQRELAREFATSVTTVSKVLDQLASAGFVDKAPRRGTHVLPVADRPARGAVAIVTSRPAGIGDPNVCATLRGIQETLIALNQHYQFVDIDKTPDLSARILMDRYSAVLSDQCLREKVILELEACRFPYVVANLEQDLDLTCTWVDHGKTTRTAVRFLAAFGHKSIALLTRPERYFFYAKAIAGYRDGLAEAGTPYDESLVLRCDERDSLNAYLRMRDYLAEHDAPTGLVATRDYMAQGAYHAFAEKGLVVGRDVSLIGFDDHSWPQREPFLTTFAEPDYALGAVAAEILVERLISGWRPARKYEIEAPLVLRRSAGPCMQDSSLSKHRLELIALPEAAHRAPLPLGTHSDESGQLATSLHA